MAIFEATNITPAIYTQTQSVDVTADTVAISWQVNGNSPLKAFQIDFYYNDNFTTSPIFTTGKITTGIPTGGFYGTDGNGNPQTFSFTVAQTWTEWSGNVLSNGNDYAYTITQFYTANNTTYKINSVSLTAGTTYYFTATQNGTTYYITYTPTESGTYTLYYDLTNGVAFRLVGSSVYPVTMGKLTAQPSGASAVTASVITSDDSFYHVAFISQNGASVVTARAIPTISLYINNVESPTTIATSKIAVTGVYTQAEEETIKSLQWLLYDLAGDLIDSTPILNTQQLSYSYDGLFNNDGYTITLKITTQNNRVVTKSVNFTVAYSQGTYTGYFTAKCNCKDMSTLLSWEAVKTIKPVVTGTEPAYTKGFNNTYYASLPSGTTITYSTVDDEAMSFTSPYTIAIKNKITLNSTGASGNIKFTATGISVASTVSGTTLTIAIVIGSNSYSLTADGATYTADMSELIITPTQAVLYLFDNGALVATISTVISYTQSTIALTSLYGVQDIYCYSIYNGYTDYLLTLLKDATFEPNWGSSEYSLYMSANMNGNAGGGTGSVTGDGFHIYKAEVGSVERYLVAKVGSNVTALKDFATTSGKSYNYYLAVYDNAGAMLGEKTATTDKSESSSTITIKPTFNYYSLLSTAYNNNDGCYHVEKEYQFSLNLSDTSRSNNNTPSSYENFTRYRTYQNSCQRYESGMLQGLIGSVDMSGNTYKETAKLRKELSALSETDNTLFLRTMKGELLMVKISAPIQLPFTLSTKEMQTSFSLTWEECGDASEVAIMQSPLDSGWISDNAMLDVVLDVDLATGMLIVKYPEDYDGTTFSMNSEYLTAETPDDMTAPTFDYNSTEALTPADGTLSVVVDEE